MAINDGFSIIKDISLSIAAITTAIVAWKGLESWKKILKGKADFDVAALEAEALFGIDIKNKTLEFRKCVNELRAGIESYIRNEYSGQEDFKADNEFAKEVSEIVHSAKPDENPLALKIQASIDGLQIKIKPFLSRS